MMEMGKLAIGLFETGESDSGGGFGGRAADLSKTVFEPFRHVDAHTVLGTGHRVSDRLTDRFDDSAHAEVATPGLDIDVELDRPEQRF